MALLEVTAGKNTEEKCGLPFLVTYMMVGTIPKAWLEVNKRHHTM